MRSAAKNNPPTIKRGSPAKPHDNANPPRKTLASLAAVELQSIAHFLPLRSILIFARCSRALFQSMQSPLTFKFTECRVRSNALPPDTEVALNGALVRHVPLSLQVAHRRPLDSSVCNVLPAPVMQLHTTASGVQPGEWLAFVTHPVMQSLRVLDLSDCESTLVSQELMMAIIALQKLHTITLHPHCGSVTTFFSMLPLAPALTSLTTRSYVNACFEQSLDPVARCPLLTSVSLKYPCLDNGSLPTLFTSAPLCNRLRQLTLDTPIESRTALGAAGDSPIAFGSLTSLTALTLKQVDIVNALLAGLAKVAALTSLSLEYASWSSLPSHALPTVSTLAHLLAALPALMIRLRLVRLVDLFDGRGQAGIEDLTELAHGYMRADELRPFASRVHALGERRCG